MKLKDIPLLMALCLVAALSIPQAFAQAADAPESMTGVKVEEKAPEFALKDQEGKVRTLKSLLEQEGTTVLVFHRSADW